MEAGGSPGPRQEDNIAILRWQDHELLDLHEGRMTPIGVKSPRDIPALSAMQEVH